MPIMGELLNSIMFCDVAAHASGAIGRSCKSTFSQRFFHLYLLPLLNHTEIQPWKSKNATVIYAESTCGAGSKKFPTS
jgi:hypothetical protein